MSKFIELEIQKLLNEKIDLSHICDRLIQKIEQSNEYHTLDNINALARFLLNTNQPIKLIQFVVHHIDNESFPIPWPYFLEALNLFSESLDAEIIKALVEGIHEDNAESEAARAKGLNQVLPEIGEWQQNRKYKLQKDYLNNKHLLLDQLVTLRTQQLVQQEKLVLQRLQQFYPGDVEIQREVNEHKQRYALNILQRRTSKVGHDKEDYLPNEPDVEKARQALMTNLKELANEEPQLALDFAIIAFILESYEDSLSLLSCCEETVSWLWFRLEVLLKCRRFVELLAELTEVEIRLAHEPETFFATAYLRAQALWGLGQKHTAIEILEALLAARPHYRSAGSLLRTWSNS